jgi:hypothetical protein
VQRQAVAELQGWIVRLTIVVAIWSLWPIAYPVWPAKPGDGPPAPRG